MKTREERRRVRIEARMRTDTGWSAVSIRNVSAHGMMLHAERAPRLGAYLDIQREGQWYTVRTVWVNGRSFGVRAQDLIDISRLVAARPASAARAESPPGPGPGAAARRPSDPERSHAIGRMIQFGALIAAIMLAAGVVANGVGGALRVPVTTIGEALSPTR